MTQVQNLAKFVDGVRFHDLSYEAKFALKVRILDALGCAIGAMAGPPVRAIRRQVEDMGGRPRCTLFGGGATAPDRAALYNGALIRYLDYNDSYLAPGETCHPSDNVAPVLAASEYNHGSGEDFLTALAIAYQVQCRLSDVAPVRGHGFDHTTQGAYAVAAAVAKALRLDAAHIAHAIAIAGTSLNALRVTRTGHLSNWKGLAYPATSFGAMHAAFLAKYGITGPLEVFEGNKGFMEAVSGPFEINWAKEGLEAVCRTSVKKYNAEFHSQSTLEAVLELRAHHTFDTRDILEVNIETFDVAYHIIGGGIEGGKKDVHTKEEADHSLPYMVAVALLDGEVLPGQYQQDRILRPDVQGLLRRVNIQPNAAYSKLFPSSMSCNVEIHLASGEILQADKDSYEGFYTQPFTWEQARAKFDRLAAAYASEDLRNAVSETVAHLEDHSVTDLTALLAKAGAEAESGLQR